MLLKHCGRDELINNSIPGPMGLSSATHRALYIPSSPAADDSSREDTLVHFSDESKGKVVMSFSTFTKLTGFFCSLIFSIHHFNHSACIMNYILCSLFLNGHRHCFVFVLFSCATNVFIKFVLPCFLLYDKYILCKILRIIILAPYCL